MNKERDLKIKNIGKKKTSKKKREPFIQELLPFFVINQPINNMTNKSNVSNKKHDFC